MKTESNLVYGIRSIMEAIQSGMPVYKVYLQAGLRGSLFTELEKLIRNSGISVSYVPIEKLKKFTPQNHQGAVAQISPIAFHEFEPLAESIIAKETSPLFLLLDHITDVRNFGAILRTAECCGVHAVIVPGKGAAPLNQDTIKTSAGAAFRVPICRTDHLLDAIYYLSSSGVTMVAATEKTESSIYDLDLRGPLALIMGSEDRGIAPAILKTVEHKGKLPLLGAIGSLNVSVACGAMLYEIVRQRINAAE